MEGVIENDNNPDEQNLNTEGINVHDGFQKLLYEVQLELYLVFTSVLSLDYLAKLMHIKVINRLSDSSFD